ncbi:PDGLE domain-containing protein [Paenibacillus gansuensis]|uniref:PDGLE domain-containing protein n=1 Tax=Paenibacillus gansuensis TaxID=306542 RepID=A0ABW5P9Z1_9BACL
MKFHLSREKAVPHTEMKLTLSRWKWVGMMAGTVLIAGFLSPYASSKPDGLDRVAEDQDFASQASPVFTASPFPDYEAGGFSSSALKTGAAGIIGILALVGVLYGITYLLSKRGKADDQKHHRKAE